MARSEKYQPNYRGKPPKKQGSFPFFWFLFGIGLGGVLLNQPLFSRFVSQQDLTSFTSSLIDQKILPSSIVITQTVKNPVAGNPQVLTLTNTNPLDQQAAKINYSGTSVQELAEILRPYATTEADKARLIYAWIAQHISYDAQSFLNNRTEGLDLSPSGVLTSRSTICSGYANLYQTLAKEMGLEAIIIEGYGRGANYLVSQNKDINHAWNGVKVDGTWYLVDATWGAGAIDNEKFVANFDPYYFATPPEQLIYSHFPAENQWQLLPKIYTRAEFDQFPDVSTRFFRDKLQLLSHNNSDKITTNGYLEIRLVAPENIVISAQLMSESGVKLERTYTLVQKQDQQAVINVAFPSPGKYQLILFSKNKQEEISHQAVKYDIEATGTGEAFPLNYSSFAEKEAYLGMPLTKSLPINKAAYFQLKVHQASKVVVINQETNNWTELTPSNDFFAGSVMIDAGKTIVAAKFSDSDQYWTLLEYN